MNTCQQLSQQKTTFCLCYFDIIFLLWSFVQHPLFYWFFIICFLLLIGQFLQARYLNTWVSFSLNKCYIWIFIKNRKISNTAFLSCVYLFSFNTLLLICVFVSLEVGVGLLNSDLCSLAIGNDKQYSFKCI